MLEYFYIFPHLLQYQYIVIHYHAASSLVKNSIFHDNYIFEGRGDQIKNPSWKVSTGAISHVNPKCFQNGGKHTSHPNVIFPRNQMFILFMNCEQSMKPHNIFPVISPCGFPIYLTCRKKESLQLQQMNLSSTYASLAMALYFSCRWPVFIRISLVWFCLALGHTLHPIYSLVTLTVTR